MHRTSTTPTRWFFLLGLTLLLTPLRSTAQNLPFDINNSRTSAEFGLPWYGELSKSAQVGESQFLEAYVNQYLSDQSTTFKEIKRSSDDVGWDHVRYQQYSNGIKINHGILNLHVKNGRVESFNGEVYTVPAVAENFPAYQEAKTRFLASYAAYQEATFLKEEESATPIYSADQDGRSMDLVYLFHVDFTRRNQEDLVFYKPLDQLITRIEPQIIHGDSVGTAKTYYRGTKTIITDYVGTAGFLMRENARPIRTHETTLGNFVTDADNEWKTSGKEIAGDVHWGMELVHEFMDSTFGWDSYANNGDSMSSVLNLTGSGNAFWNLGGNYSTFLVNKTSSVNPCASLDVVAHEFGHGIADENAGLVYTGEACMLHESFADINGSVLEYYADSTKGNWLLGEEVWASRGGIRNMQNPSAFGHPDTYGGTGWGRGCHGNGGVQNYWFYLMVEGDTGTNDKGTSYAIRGLGRDTAIQIMYRAMFYYVTPNTTFQNMANYTLKAAKDLYGSCGHVLQMTWDAWDAVGIQDTTVQLINLDHGIVAPALRCTDLPISQTFKSKGDQTRSVFWDFGNSDTTSAEDVTKTLSTYGNRTIYLRTEVCNRVFNDTLNMQVNAQPEAKFSPNQSAFCLHGNDTLFATNQTVNDDPSQNLLYSWVMQPYDVTVTTKDLAFPMKDREFYFSVDLTAYYATGCQSTYTEYFDVDEVAQAQFSAKSVCVGEEIKVSNTTDTKKRVVEYNWKVTGSQQTAPLYFTNVETPSITLADAQHVTIELSVLDTATRCETKATQMVEIYGNPVPTFTASNTCLGDSVLFTNTTTHDTTITWFKWDFGFYEPFNKTTIKQVAKAAGPMVVGLEVRADNGCKVKMFDTIQIENTQASFTSGEVCLNDQKTFVNTSIGDNLSFSWDFGDGATSTDSNGVNIYTTGGVYPVVLTATSTNCVSKQSTDVTILEVPKGDFEIAGVCDGDSSHFTNTTQANGQKVTYRWLFGDGDSASNANPTHYYAIGETTTSFNVTLTSSADNGCQEVFSKWVTINELPHCGFTHRYAWPSRDVVFTPDSSNYASYAWDFGDGARSNDMRPTHDFSNDKVYEVVLVAESKEGCICAQTIEVNGSNVGVADLESQNLTLFPNPNHGSFVINGLEQGQYDFEITDVYGRIVQEGSVNTSGEASFDFDFTTSGVYLIQLNSDGLSRSVKFIVQ